MSAHSSVAQTSAIPKVGGHPGTVYDAMVRRPKVLRADATVAEVRTLLADDHVHMVLLVRGNRLVGTVTRTDLENAAVPRPEALSISTLEGRTVLPGECVAAVHSDMISSAQRRLAVIDNHGRLLGLLCLKRSRTGFCTDRDVASREAEAILMTGRVGEPHTPDGPTLELPVGSSIPAHTGR